VPLHRRGDEVIPGPAPPANGRRLGKCNWRIEQTQPSFSTWASAQAGPASCAVPRRRRYTCPPTLACGIQWREAAMKIWLKSWKTRGAARGSAAVVNGWVGWCEGDLFSLIAAEAMQHVAGRRLPGACARALRRNRCRRSGMVSADLAEDRRRKRSMAPTTTPVGCPEYRPRLRPSSTISRTAPRGERCVIVTKASYARQLAILRQLDCRQAPGYCPS